MKRNPNYKTTYIVVYPFDPASEPNMRNACAKMHAVGSPRDCIFEDWNDAQRHASHMKHSGFVGVQIFKSTRFQ